MAPVAWVLELLHIEMRVSSLRFDGIGLPQSYDFLRSSLRALPSSTEVIGPCSQSSRNLPSAARRSEASASYSPRGFFTLLRATRSCRRMRSFFVCSVISIRLGS